MHPEMFSTSSLTDLVTLNSGTAGNYVQTCDVCAFSEYDSVSNHVVGLDCECDKIDFYVNGLAFSQTDLSKLIYHSRLWYATLT